ncbi:allophanate hydrolase [Acidovorax sp. NCPPB 2350]|nr:allophanate hydrolase [Acidovorax sp. NCPPB 2350]
MTEHPLTIAEWLQAGRAGGPGPATLLHALRERLGRDDPAWITPCDAPRLQAQLRALEGIDPATLPLFGVPFAVKDNIDVAGWPTTAACPAFAHEARHSAAVVRRLQAAGAIVIGKTNLDQFATGLVGARSPYGRVPNTFDPRYVSGGSSSGSASVVARGLVPFALGTDTAGSGRVPAGLNNIVGLKPTPGTVPMDGVLPACRTLDVVSVFALRLADAATVLGLLQGTGEEPVFQAVEWQPAWLGSGARPVRIGVPRQPDCDAALGYDAAFGEAVQRLRAQGAEAVPVDMAPLDAVAQLLYDGPWVAERYAVVRELLERHPEHMDPTVQGVIAKARQFDARQAFEARYRLAELAGPANALWDGIDALMVPTVPTCPTFEALERDPVARNSELGRYTNFVNLLGWSALSLPSGLGSAGLPFGVTFIGPPGADAALVEWGLAWERATPLAPGARLARQPPLPTPGSPASALRSAPTLRLAVVGAHLQGLPLHHQLTERHCRLLRATRTAPRYRLYALAGTTPPKPGLVRAAEPGGGAAIDVEVYEMPLSAVGSFLAAIPFPLGLGRVELEDGEWVAGFACDPAGLAGARDITEHGGWRNYLSGREARHASA